MTNRKNNSATAPLPEHNASVSIPAVTGATRGGKLQEFVGEITNAAADRRSAERAAARAVAKGRMTQDEANKFFGLNQPA